MHLQQFSFDVIWEELKRITGPDWVTFPTLAERRPNHFCYNPDEDAIELRTSIWRPGQPHRKLERALLASAWETLVAAGRASRMDFPRQKHSSAVITLLARLSCVRPIGPDTIALIVDRLSPEQLDEVVEELLADPDQATSPVHPENETEANPEADDALISRLNLRNRNDPTVRHATVKQFERDSRLSRLIKRKRGYRCQVCDDRNLFPASGGHPYVETHHLDWLSDEGLDVEENLLVVCAVCHRKFHYGVPLATVTRQGRDLTVTLCGVATRVPGFTERR